MGKGKETTSLVFVVLSLLIIFPINIFNSFNKPITLPERKPTLSNFGNLPLYFIRNDGQIDRRVRFYEKGAGHSVFFTEDGIYITLTQNPGARQSFDDELRGFKDRLNLTGAKKPKSEVVILKPLNAKKGVKISAEEEQSGRINYLTGRDPKSWKTGIPTYRKIRYEEIYDGVDIVFYGNNSQLEYDIIAEPGADISKVEFEYEGIEKLTISEEGNLVALLPSGEEIIQKRPNVYQMEKDGSRNEISAEYRIISSENRYIFKFAIKGYDKHKLLTIDPTLIYSTYLGGSGEDWALSVAVDSYGNAYVTGMTNSVDFPLKNPIQSTYGGGSYDVFITKINASGTKLLYSTYLGGSGDDRPQEIVVDSYGNVYMTGVTNSVNFPLKNPIQSTYGGGSYDAFITKINSSGTELLYSTYLGGTDREIAYDITIDSFGNSYVTGVTISPDFPTKVPMQPTINGDFDIFITKINSSGSELVYSTYFGGSSYESAYGIAVDSLCNIYIVGMTGGNFPLKNAIQPTYGGGVSDAFVTKINASGNSLIYSTYLGGKSDDSAYSIAVDFSANAYIAGLTLSNNFPLKNPIQPIYGGNTDAFVAKINALGTGLVYSTYLGGSNREYFTVLIAVDSIGNAYLVGSTESRDFPLKNPLRNYHTVDYDVFITKINTLGTKLLYSTYFGGEGGQDIAYGLDIDNEGNVYVVGRPGLDFPLKNPIQMSLNDAFLAKISDEGPYTLTVRREGIGTGGVTSDPAGINCGSVCSYAFPAGAIITLTAQPDAYSTFSHWSGDINSTNSTITMIMDSDKTVIATFDSKPLPDLCGELLRVSKSESFMKRTDLRSSLRIRNIGDSSTTGTFTIAYYLSNDGISLDTLIGTQKILLPISNGGSRTILFVKTFADKNILAGRYLIAVIDAQNNVPEKDESNNRVIFGPLL